MSFFQSLHRFVKAVAADDPSRFHRPGSVSGTGDAAFPADGSAAPVVRLGSWLVFLVISLLLPVSYLLQATIPVGTDLLRVFGWGGAIGAVLGVIAFLFCAPGPDSPTAWSRLSTCVGCIALGSFGGAGGAAWLDRLKVVERRAVELPVAAVRQMQGRDGAVSVQVATLSPLDPTGEDRLSPEDIVGTVVREGACLTGLVQKGWLGGRWRERYATAACSQTRGPSGRYVIVTSNAFASWRWHQRDRYALIGHGAAFDAGLPQDLTCRVRPGGWLYRCARR